jgi:hypothetical protein
VFVEVLPWACRTGNHLLIVTKPSTRGNAVWMPAEKLSTKSILFLVAAVDDEDSIHVGDHDVIHL